MNRGAVAGDAGAPVAGLPVHLAEVDQRPGARRVIAEPCPERQCVFDVRCASSRIAGTPERHAEIVERQRFVGGRMEGAGQCENFLGEGARGLWPAGKRQQAAQRAQHIESRGGRRAGHRREGLARVFAPRHRFRERVGGGGGPRGAQGQRPRVLRCPGVQQAARRALPGPA